MSLHNKYDIIIVGGGISGLYSAYKILKMAPETKLLVLEGHKKQWLGGRLGNEMFQGTQVVTGAGVGRKEKDYLLIELLRELKVPYNEFQVAPKPAQTISPPCNVKKLINILKKQFKEKSAIAPVKKTFKEFALPILGPELYKNLTICLGYTDYENEDVYDTLYNYGLEDNFDTWTALHVPWKLLVETIAKKVGIKNIHCSSYVTNIEQLSPCNFIVKTDKGNTYLCNKVILATTISSIQKLLPNDPIYQQIHGQTFLRLYGKFTKSSTEIVKQYVPGYTIVPGPLKKIIPMDTDKGVYMIAYSDNEDAKYLKDRLMNTQKNRDYFCELLEEALGIPKGALNLISIKDYYWPVGTHYYEPLHGPFKNRKDFIKKAQNPMTGMLVVGEMISMNQGWTQGALESVESVVTKKWLDSEC
jgi:Flavin containing amine oxidoreductase